MSDTRKLLIVDDEQALLRLLTIRLRLCGYKVVTAASGREALELIGTQKPDLILLDIIMPGMDGFQVLLRMRKSCRAPVLVMSAKQENAGRALAMGAAEFISKPFDVEMLVKAIQRNLP